MHDIASQHRRYNFYILTYSKTQVQVSSCLRQLYNNFSFTPHGSSRDCRFSILCDTTDAHRTPTLIYIHMHMHVIVYMETNTLKNGTKRT